MAAMAQQVDFGCVPHSVVEGLQEIGNWKVRAAAVEALHSTVLDIRDVLPLLPTLSKFLQFLMSLVDDPNFKVSISAMRIVQDLLGKLGPHVQPYLGTVMETLINKLGDRNEAVRQAVAAVMAALMQTLGPQPVLNSLGGAFVHPEWRVREQGLNVVLLALLSHGKDKFDYPSVVRAFSQGAGDESERVRTVSLEGLAALHERLGPLLQGLLTAVGAPDGAKRQVADRIKAGLPTPYLNVDGQLEHQVHARPASAGRPKAPRATAAVAGQPALPPAQPAAAVAAVMAAPVPNEPQSAAPTAVQTGKAAAAAAAAGPQLPRSPPMDMQASAPQPLAALEVQQQLAGVTPFALAMVQDDAAQLLQGVVEPQPLPEFGSPTASAAGLAVDWASCSPPAVMFQPSQAVDSPGGMQHLMVDTRYPSWSSSMASSPGGASFVPDPGCYSADAGAANMDDGSNAGVERSGESLLQWVRPGRGGSLSQTSRQGGVARSGGSLSPGASRPAALPHPGSEPALEAMSSRSSSFSSVPGQSPLGSSRPSLSLTPPSPGAPYYPDMYVSMAATSPSALGSSSSSRSPFAHSYSAPVQAADGVHMPAPIQHRRPTRGSSLSSAASTSRGAASGPAEVWETLPSAGSGPASSGGADAEVEGRSDSLLMWRLPARPGASTKKAPLQEPPAAQQPARWQEPEGARMAAAPEPPRSSSASVGSSILQKLDGFKKKLFGPDMPAAPAAGQQESGGAPWSIPAIRTDPESRSTSRLDSVQLDDPASQQGSSPTKGAARLSTLKRRQQEAAERRRVWSAPVSSAPQSQRTTMNDPEEEEQGQPANDAAPGAGEAGSLSPAVSPVRPGLQALKVRARTARIVASGSEAQPPASPSMYGMDVLADVFGPDRAALTTAWSPMQHGHSPGRVSLLMRAGSPGWTPSSPGSAGGTPGAHRRLGTSFLQKLGGSPGTADPGSPAAFSPTATDLSPLNDPEGTMRKLLQALEQANMSQKKELDWQSQYEALCNARRIIHNHAFALLPHIHPFVLAAAPVMDSLRSIPARLAITVFQELIEVLGPALDGELEHLVPVLIKKAGIVSVAGRDNFLAVEADKALGTLVNTASEARVVTALLNCLSTTKAADVKGKISIHLDAAIQRHGHRLVANAAIASKVLRVAVGFLDEGSLECRTSGKRILWEMRRLMDISLGPDEFRKALGRLEVKTNKVWETLESQQGRPPPPVRPHPAVRSPSGSMLAPVGFQPPSPGAGRPSSLLSTASLGYATLGDAGMPLDLHSTVTYQPTPSAAAPAPPAIAKPGSATLRPTVSFKTLTLGTAEAGAAGGSSGSSSSAAPPGRTPSAGSPLRRNLRPPSGRQAGASSAVPLAEVDPELALQVDSLQASLTGKDWRERMQALGTLRELAPRLPALPGDTLLRLMDVLGSQLTAANLKVQLEALGIMAAVFGAVGGAGVGPGLNSLVPALARSLDSGSMNARQLAADALDALLASTDAALFVQPYMQALSGSGNARSKSVLLDRLRGFAPGLYAAKPQMVVRHVLPPLFSALGDKKLDVREALQGVLAALAGCMGLELLDACIAAAPAHKLMISELVAQQQGQLV